MNKINSKVDAYLVNGCMRCKLGGTPECKVNNWREELKSLRQIVLKSNLNEEVKWGVPCYTSEDKNIVMVSAFKEYICLSFFKGALLKDKENILIKQGERSQSVRIIKYTSCNQIIKQADIIQSYIKEAIEIEKSEKKVELKNSPTPIPDELRNEFVDDTEFKNAFYGLTPGRQRGYLIYFSQPKNSHTRINRIKKSRENILNGIGMNDYKKHSQ